MVRMTEPQLPVFTAPRHSGSNGDAALQTAALNSAFSGHSTVRKLRHHGASLHVDDGSDDGFLQLQEQGVGSLHPPRRRGGAASHDPLLFDAAGGAATATSAAGAAAGAAAAAAGAGAAASGATSLAGAAGGSPASGTGRRRPRHVHVKNPVCRMLVLCLRVVARCCFRLYRMRRRSKVQLLLCVMLCGVLVLQFAQLSSLFSLRYGPMLVQWLSPQTGAGGSRDSTSFVLFDRTDDPGGPPKRITMLDLSLSPAFCQNTKQGWDLLADDRGRLCSRGLVQDSTDAMPGCCPDGDVTGFQRYTCDGCDPLYNCCSQYEVCVSCCLDPARVRGGVPSCVWLATGAVFGRLRSPLLSPFFRSDRCFKPCCRLAPTRRTFRRPRRLRCAGSSAARRQDPPPTKTRTCNPTSTSTTRP